MASFSERPLIYRLVSRVQASSGPTYDEAYARIARLLRRYNATSVVEAALRLLWADYATKIDALQIAPWHVMLIVKWALRDPHVALRVGPAISAQAFDEVRQSVHELLSLEHKRHPPKNIFLMMRAHLQQVEFQRPEGWGFLRWPALIARQPESQPTHRQFLDLLALPPAHFIDLSLALFAVVISKDLPIAPELLEPMRPTYGSSVDAVWRLVARDLAGLREELRRDKVRRLPARQELYEFPYLKRFPLVRMRDGRYHCWHPMVYARGLEDLVHLKLSDLRDEYTEPFSRLFERYVVELTKAMDAGAIDEDAYRQQMGGQPTAVEAAITYGDLNVFVEAKMSLFADDVLLTDNEVQAHQKTKRLRDGIKQAWGVGEALRSPGSPFPAFAAATQDFLLLVTSRELFVGDGVMLQRLYRTGDFDYPDEPAHARLPLNNVFVLSIETFEKLSCSVAAGEVALPALLREASTRNQDAARSSILFEGYLDKYITKRRLPQLLEATRDTAQARLAAAFGGPPDSLRPSSSGDA